MLVKGAPGFVITKFNSFLGKPTLKLVHEWVNTPWFMLNINTSTRVSNKHGAALIFAVLYFPMGLS